MYYGNFLQENVSRPCPIYVTCHKMSHIRSIYVLCLGAMADLEKMAQDGGNPFLKGLNLLTDP